jgi:hypothetical protein
MIGPADSARRALHNSRFYIDYRVFDRSFSLLLQLIENTSTFLLTILREPGSSHLHAPRLIASTRLIEGHFRDDLLQQAEQDARLLHDRLSIAQRLRLTSQDVIRQYAVGRIYLTAAGSGIISDFFVNSVGLSQLLTGYKIVTQLDYDQKDTHVALHAYVPDLLMASSHFPSAAATHLLFSYLLEHRGISSQQAKWCVVGVGEVGRRLVQLLQENGSHDIRVCDTNPSVVAELCADRSVTAVTMIEALRTDLDALVFCSPRGTFTESVANALAQNGSISVAGGPEAGIADNLGAVQRLEATGKWFVPSSLCGSVGLLCNLEEMAGLAIDLPAQLFALQSRAQEILNHGSTRNLGFYASFRELYR